MDHREVIQAPNGGVIDRMFATAAQAFSRKPARASARMSPLRSVRLAVQIPSPVMAEPVSSEVDWAGLIVSIAARRDREAFAQLFQHFAPRVKAYLKRGGLNDGAAEEVAQETLITVWRKAALFDPAGLSASGWIFTIARNLRIDLVRREGRRPAGTSKQIEAEFALDEAPLPDAETSTIQSERRVRNALETLSEEQRRVIELSYYEERAHSDIARTLGIPLGTVKSRLRLAVARLRHLLDETL